MQTCRFEVLYPPDTNDTPIGRAVNYPAWSGRRTKLACLKTENFTFTGNRNLDKARMSLECGAAGYGFPAAQRSHLIGIGGAHGALAAGVVDCHGERSGIGGAVRAGPVLLDRLLAAARARSESLDFMGTA